MKKFEKIFIIGYNKTATCSLDCLFHQNGWATQHRDGNWEIEKSEVFSDQHAEKTNHFNFKKLAADYPHALFILNLRKLDSWIMSRCGHVIFNNALMTMQDGNRPTTQSWGYPSLVDICGETRSLKVTDAIKDKYFQYIKGRIKRWVDERESYYNDILTFFKDNSKQFLIVNIHNDWKEFVIEHVMDEHTKITTDRMLATDRDNFKEIRSLNPSDKKLYDNFLSVHLDLAKQAMNEVLSEYPPSVKESLLLHDANDNQKFLNIYKNNFGLT